MGSRAKYWEFYVTDDVRRRYVSPTFDTDEECLEDMKSKLKNASGSYTSKIVVKLFLSDGEKTVAFTNLQM
jgi:hypothetical protein